MGVGSRFKTSSVLHPEQDPQILTDYNGVGERPFGIGNMGIQGVGSWFSTAGYVDRTLTPPGPLHPWLGAVNTIYSSPHKIKTAAVWYFVVFEEQHPHSQCLRARDTF